MGFWDVLDILEASERWMTSKEIQHKLGSNYITTNKHLRKLVKLGYIKMEAHREYIDGYKVPYNTYKVSEKKNG